MGFGVLGGVYVGSVSRISALHGFHIHGAFEIIFGDLIKCNFFCKLELSSVHIMNNYSLSCIFLEQRIKKLVPFYCYSYFFFLVTRIFYLYNVFINNFCCTKLSILHIYLILQILIPLHLMSKQTSYMTP